MIRKLNLLKTFVICLSISVNCSGIKLIDGLINDLHIKVKTNRGHYIESTIEEITPQEETGIQNQTQRKIERICSNQDFCEEFEEMIELNQAFREKSYYEKFNIENTSTYSIEINTDEGSISDWDEDIEETPPLVQLKTFDLNLIDSDFFIIEIWSESKMEFSIICYKNEFLENIPYYIIILTQNTSYTERQPTYNFHLCGKRNPLSNRISHTIELKIPTRRFSISKRNRFEN